MPASSPPEAFDLAIVALSARALARSGRRAGLRVLALDLFADADTREHASSAVKVAARRSGFGFDRSALIEALAANAPQGLPVVLGAGLEHDVALMRRIAARNPLIGASPEAVARLKDPWAFAQMLAALGAPHPAIEAPGGGPRSGWLSKRAGASGGAHIRLNDMTGARRYRQQRVEGRPISALFLADGRDAQVLGFSEQWTDPAPRAPFRYGGAVGPVPVAPAFAEAVADVLARLVALTGLRGLASADLMATGDGAGFVLIEINPRPGASLDVFDRSPWPSLLALHLDACAGRLPDALPPLAGAAATAVAHAPIDVAPDAIARPHWTADWPSCDETVPAGAPFCTVFAAGPDHQAARRLVSERRNGLLAFLTSARVPAPTNPW